jgi:NAD(P)-dependent dehydrogenase (short-subunit alcohol dehydrogenase family)
VHLSRGGAAQGRPRPGTAERILERRREVAPQLVHQAHIADLSILGDTRDVGARIAVEEPRIDVLINNAGNLFARRGVTAAGWCTVLTNIRSR